MTAKIDPYKILGVEREASPAQIKSAYRKKAMETHPDRGGHRSEFDKVNRANIVLSDAAKRDKFDRTGEIDDDSPNNVISAPLGIIIGFLQMAVQQHVAGQGGDPCETDILKIGRQHFSKTISDLEKQKKQLARMADRLKRIASKIKPKNGKENLLYRPLMTQADTLAAQASLADQQIKAHKDAIAMLETFDFDFDKVTGGYGSSTSLSGNPFW